MIMNHQFMICFPQGSHLVKNQTKVKIFTYQEKMAKCLVGTQKKLKQKKNQ